MNIDKAIEHFKWKLQNHWTPTETDLEAYNSILDYKELQESANMSANESLAKLWVHQLMLLSNTNLYNGERSIQVIDEILEQPLYDWCVKLKNQLPMMRFNAVALEKHPLGSFNSLTAQLERNNKIVEEFETELTEALKYEPKEEDTIKFVQSQITRVINKFEK